MCQLKNLANVQFKLIKVITTMQTVKAIPLPNIVIGTISPFIIKTIHVIE